MPEINNFFSVPSKIVEIIKTSSTFLLITHVRPDGDAIGAITGLLRSLRKAGKQVEIALADPPPARFAFLLANERILKPGWGSISQEVVVLLDCGDLSRSGFENELANIADSRPGKLINIDHHATNTKFGHENFLDIDASSTCEMLVALILSSGLPFDPEVAEGLYLGLLTDSRFFQNEGLRPSVFRAAELLLSTGFNTSNLLSRLNQTRSLSELKILGKGLANLKTDCQGLFSSFVLTAKDILECGSTLEEVWSSGLFGQLVSLKKVVVGLGVIEGPDGRTYCEFRSRQGFDVREIALKMGGGGHCMASGCNKAEPFDKVAHEAKSLIMDKISYLLNNSG